MCLTLSNRIYTWKVLFMFNKIFPQTVEQKIFAESTKVFKNWKK
jgi:hypothetical protein